MGHPGTGTTPAVIATTHTAASGPRRPGRPRKPVELTPVALNPLLAGEHRDALRALSTLLVHDDETAQPQPVLADGHQGIGTQRVLAALSSAGAKMPSRPDARRDNAA